MGDMVIVPAPGTLPGNDGRGIWLHQMCTSLLKWNETAAGTPIALLGSLMVNGQCLYDSMGLKFPKSAFSAEFFQGSYESPQVKNFSEVTAVKVSVSTTLDVFAEEGQDWIKTFRDELDEFALTAQGVKLLGSGGNIYLTGEGCNQLDNSDKAYRSFIPMLALMMGLVVILLGATFRSIVVPLRAVVCLLWMIVMTFGVCIATFQSGWFDSLGWEPLKSRELGAMYWMSPLIAFAIVVGLGLDYDIFYTERVHEEKHKGYSDSEAAVRALAFTANTISAAGVIMVMAFSALLVSTTAAMNEISLLLIIGILCDCFVTTKCIIPASVALLDGYNFWPSKIDASETLGTPEGCKLFCGISRCCNSGNV